MTKAVEGKLIKIYQSGNELYGYKCISDYSVDVDLTRSYSRYSSICPVCGSDNVCFLHYMLNKDMSSWYCISCYLRWEAVSLSCPICNHFRINCNTDGTVAYCSKCNTRWSPDDLLIQLNEVHY